MRAWEQSTELKQRRLKKLPLSCYKKLIELCENRRLEMGLSKSKVDRLVFSEDGVFAHRRYSQYVHDFRKPQLDIVVELARFFDIDLNKLK